MAHELVVQDGSGGEDIPGFEVKLMSFLTSGARRGDLLRSSFRLFLAALGSAHAIAVAAFGADVSGDDRLTVQEAPDDDISRGCVDDPDFAGIALVGSIFKGSQGDNFTGLVALFLKGFMDAKGKLAGGWVEGRRKLASRFAGSQVLTDELAAGSIVERPQVYDFAAGAGVLIDIIQSVDGVIALEHSPVSSND